jgi:AcrR family transcriptional regulator
MEMDMQRHVEHTLLERGPSMTRVTRDDWIEEGFRVLVEEGDGGLTVDALCARLDRSKGSFYHHFEGRPGYVHSLLESWERAATDRLIETGHADAPVEARMRAVNRQASELKNARLERAIRGWSAREPLAREVQDRVDRRRLAFLEELCVERMGESEDARRLARVFQLAFVGAQHLDPPLEGEELYRTFRFLDPLFDVRRPR